MQSLRDMLAESGMSEGGKSESFKVKEGTNKIRICSDFIFHESIFKGTKSKKFVCWVIDRADGKVKPYFAPYTIVKALSKYQEDEDYHWVDAPMTRDLIIDAKDAGTKEVDYQCHLSLKETPLTAVEQADLEQKGSIEAFIEKIKEKQEKENPTEPVIDADDEPNESVLDDLNPLMD
jgi:hypothetical protein